MKILAFAVLTGVAAAAAIAAPPKGAAGPAATGMGAALFETKCLICHQEGGTGTFMLGRRLGNENALLANRTDLDANYVRAVVRQGVLSMPRFTRVELPDAQLDQIAAYLTRPRGTR